MHFIYDYDYIAPRAFCSIESLTKLNTNVKILARNPELFAKRHRNIQVEQLDYKDVFSDTPLADWYSSDSLVDARLKSFDMTDAARLAVLYKNGGFYSDLDIIYFNTRFMRTMNKVAAQHPLGNPNSFAMVFMVFAL